MAERQLVASAGNHHVRRTAGGTLRLVGGDDFFIEGFEQFLKRGAVGMFGGVATLEGAFELAQVFVNRRGPAATAVGGWFFAQIIGVGHNALFRRQSRLWPNNKRFIGGLCSKSTRCVRA